MASLSTFRDAGFPDFVAAEADLIHPARIFYVYQGRNAWHSTWTTSYSEGCMHGTLQSAKDFAEKKRIQGTVFNIREMPAIVFRSSVGDVVVTQINTNVPLSLYSPDALDNAGFITDITPALPMKNYIYLGAPISEAAKSFSWHSQFWHSKPPASNSVVVVATRDISSEYTHDIDSKLHAYTSYSHGSKYRLGWHTRENSISSEPVNRILSNLGCTD